MTRLEANQKIISILGGFPTPEMIEAVDIFDLHSYITNKVNLKNKIEERPQYRFIQLLWAMGINGHGRGEGDRFYEESTETLKKLKECLENLSTNLDNQ